MSRSPYKTTEQVRESVRRTGFLGEDYSHDDDRALIARRRETEFERPVERIERFERIERRPQFPQPVRAPVSIVASAPVVSTELSLVKGTQAVLGPSLNRDTTIHLQLDIEEDLESRLEEFSRLKRLGNYSAAEEYFQGNLQKFTDVPPVSVEFADMLLTQGAYKRLKELRQKNKLKPPLGPDDVSVRMSKSRKRRNNRPKPVNDSNHGSDSDSDSDSSLDMSHYDGRIDEVKQSDALRTAIEITDELAPNSTSMHNILLSLEIFTHVKDESDLADWRPYLSYSKDIANYSRVYKHLLEQGRIWEARDLISACIPAFGAKQAWREVLDADLHSPDSFTKFLREWKADEYDPSTYLAILDVLVALGQYLVSSSVLSSGKDNIATAKRCLEQARDLAASIKKNDLEYIKSRPYIQWILVQEELSRKLGYEEEGRKSHKSALSFQHLQKFPGITIWTTSLPTYVPAEAENPGSHISHFPESDNELLQIALQASEELGDYRTQVLCLRELICRAKEPQQLFDKLTHLQKSVQGDMVGYLQTCISKYLYATTDESRQALIDEFVDFDGRQAMSYSIDDPLMLWHERKVQGALYLSMGLTYEAGKAQEMASKYERDLPSDVQRAIRRLRLYSNRNFKIDETMIEREMYDVPDLDRERERERERRKPISRKLRRSPDTREVEGIYGPPRTLTDVLEPRYAEAQDTYVRAPTGNFKRVRDVFLERERPAIEKQLTIPNREHGSEMSIEEVRRDFPPPPRTDFAQRRAVEWSPVLSDSGGGLAERSSDSEEGVEKNDGETNSQGNMVEEPLLERKDGETDEECKQRIEKYVLHYADMQERLDLAVTQAKLKLDQNNKTHFPPEQKSKDKKTGQIQTSAAKRERQQERERILTSPPPERVSTMTIETRERVQQRERSPSPVRYRERIVESSVVREGSPSPIRTRERIITRQRRPSTQEKPSTKESRSDLNTPRDEDEEHKGDTRGKKGPQISNSATTSLEINQKAQKANGARARSPVNWKSEKDGVVIIEELDMNAIVPPSLSRSRVAADEDIGAEDLKRRQTFPTSEEVPDDGKP
ncbi:hypothetical protein EG329_004903 [Mollisiaceae sp. DMI_Dod_QoI]|nr:hypothetical protein EG329_004903 [Helotiales sp. DMI_Dod_QoI]